MALTRISQRKASERINPTRIVDMAVVNELADVAAKAFLTDVKNSADPSITITTWKWEGSGFVFSDVKIVDFSYPNPVPPAKITPKSLDSLSWKNNTPSTGDYEEFDSTKTYTSTFSWSVTAGIKASASETVKVSIPKIGDASETASIDLNISTTVTQQTTRTDTFSAKTHINIPPYTKLTASLLISEGSLDVPWTANVQVVLGNCGVLRAPANGGTGYILDKWPGWEPGKVKKFEVRGTFKGMQGYGEYVNTDSTPIPH